MADPRKKDDDEDLGFLAPPGTKPVQSDQEGEDLGFVASAAEAETSRLAGLDQAGLTAEIVRRQSLDPNDPQAFPQGARPSLYESTRRAFLSDDGGFGSAAATLGRGIYTAATGDDRETRATRELPELTDAGLIPFLGKERYQTLTDKLGGAADALALLTSMSPVESVKILSRIAPEMQVRPDEAGNIILSLDGREVLLNAPGMTSTDWQQLGTMGLAFFGPERYASAATTIPRGMVRMGASAGAVQTGLETVQAARGGSFDVPDILTTAGLASGAYGAYTLIAQKFPLLRAKVKEFGVNDEVRQAFSRMLQRLGMQADEVSDEAIMAAVREADMAAAQQATTAERAAIAGEREFEIPLTAGQRSGDQKQLAFEDSAMVGTRGDSAEKRINNFLDNVQGPAVQQARERVEQTIAPVTGKPGDIIREGVQRAEREAMDAYEAAKVPAGSATLSNEGFVGLLKSLRRQTRRVDFDSGLPETSRLLSDLNSTIQYFENLSAKGITGVRGVDLNRLELYRRRLNTAIGQAKDSDQRQLILLKNEFDRYSNAAIDNALWSGDTAALKSLADSRKLFAEYARQFRVNKKSGPGGRTMNPEEVAAGGIVERIVEGNPTTEEIVNAVFGASGVKRQFGRAVATRYRDILGADSDGWQAVRREALNRIFQTSERNGVEYLSGSKSIKTMRTFMEENSELWGVLFSPQETAFLQRFLAQVKRTQPDFKRSRQNPSGSGVVATQRLREAFQKFGPGLFGVLAGDFSVALSGRAAGLSAGWRNSSRANAAIRPFSELDQAKPGLVTGTTATGKVVNEQNGGG